MLLAARTPNILLTLAVSLGIALWTRRRYGVPAGILAAALCAFDPNLIAHGRYVTTDFPVTAFFFFACCAVGGVPGGGHMAALAGGLGHDRAGPDHEVLGDSAASLRW